MAWPPAKPEAWYGMWTSPRHPRRGARPGGTAVGGQFGRIHGLYSAPEGDRLLHLDLHPFNVLVDESGQVSGVIDWANAAAGHPDLDRARSLAILNRDPAAVARRADPAWAALADGWQEAAGQTSPNASLWAHRYMLTDLSGRYDEDQLSGLRRAVDELTTR